MPEVSFRAKQQAFLIAVRSQVRQNCGHGFTLLPLPKLDQNLIIKLLNLLKVCLGYVLPRSYFLIYLFDGQLLCISASGELIPKKLLLKLENITSRAALFILISLLRLRLGIDELEYGGFRLLEFTGPRHVLAEKLLALLASHEVTQICITLLRLDKLPDLVLCEEEPVMVGS